MLSVTHASSVLSGYRLTLCFGISPLNLYRRLHALLSSLSLDDILACHFPFGSLAMFCQQLHMCLYLVVLCSSTIGRVSDDSLSGLVALCSAISSVQYCWYLTNIMYMGESVCEPV